ncbi:MAG: hypothetical protein HUU34_13670 [Saprospiraceae bacterium]|nr:hypothetical protein [Saprospiraceae bacterium]
MKNITPFIAVFCILLISSTSINLPVLTSFGFVSPFHPIKPLSSRYKEFQANNNSLFHYFGKPDINQSTISYSADITEGFIGISDNKPVDDVFDNIFHVQIGELPEWNDEVWLHYELNGLEDLTGLSRSINDLPATGGYIGQKSNHWIKQQERISGDWLKKGNNIIRFSLPDGANHGYRIRNLNIVIEKNQETEEKPTIAINRSTETYFHNKGYIKGILTGPDVSNASLYIDSKPVQLLKNEFECFVEKPTNADGSWAAELQAIFPDGLVITEIVRFSENHTPSFVFPLRDRELGTSKLFQTSRVGQLFYADLQIDVPETALCEDETISVLPLRDIDMAALNADLVNVTKGRKGYRLGPDGLVFEKEISIQIAYDPALVPEGYTTEDIRTFYFDEEARRWMALPKDTLIIDCNVLISKTSHFTDFIAGIIKVPESPETQGYTPTSIKDIKNEYPSAEIVTIAPPTANSMGSATTAFPLKLPDGRQGMSPQFSVQYHSEGGNGWLGLGWDIPVPFIGLDTRWGVPRYNPALETETYTLSGEQLSPVGHRQELVSRSTDKTFYPRVEGAFQRIIRYGSSPKNYWWEVTTKDGIRYSYGGRRNVGVSNGAVLRDDDDNIGHWALLEVRDLNDNFIRYHYRTIEDVGIPGGTVPGKQLYIDRVSYTGHGNDEGEYAVQFVRDRQLNEPQRQDVIISARLGFKQVTADLLREIKITFQNKPIRSYKLNYIEGAFYKTLLHEIIEYDQEEAVFYKHKFEYHDDVRVDGEYRPYHSLENWTTPSDNLGTDASLFGTTVSSGSGSTFAITFGLVFGSFTSKEFTVGGNVTSSDSESNGQTVLVDINGDGLPDKVFKENGLLKYRKNLSAEGQAAFGAKRIINGIYHFNITNNSTSGGGLEAHPFPLFFGTSDIETESITSTYFSDFNGDGLIDIAYKGRVYFNHINSSGDPVFTLQSIDTPSPIVDGAAINPTIISIDSLAVEELTDQFPLHDVVRMWQAPYPGTVTISGNVKLLSSSANTPEDDGVKVSVENEGSSVWSDNISGQDFAPRTMNITPIDVDKGERIYFRVQSIFNGSNDRVVWDPLIQYIDIPSSQIDANNRPNRRFKASEDFLVSAPQYIEIFESGTINIDGAFSKPITSDDLKVEVLKIDAGNEIPLLTQLYNWEQSYTNSPITTNINVQTGDILLFRVSSNTNIDWAKVKWTPRCRYTASPNTALIGYEFYPAVDFTMLNDVVRRSTAWTAPGSGNIQITVQPNIFIPPFVSGTVTMSVKGANTWYGETTFPIGLPTPITVTVPAGNPVFIDFHVSDNNLAYIISNTTATVAYSGGSTTVNPGIFTIITDNDRLFGPLYRGWGQFVYNGNRERAQDPIDETLLVIDPNGINASIDILNNIQTADDLAGIINPTQAIFIIMFPDPKTGSWKGFDTYTYIKRDTMSSSRLGRDDIDFNYEALFGTDLNAPFKIAISEVSSVSSGAAIIGTASSSDSDLRNILDVFDMNLDRYPDVIGETGIQHTNARGGLENDIISHELKSHLTNGSSSGFTLGGNCVVSKSANTGSTAGQGSYRISTNVSSTIDKLGNNSNEAAFSAVASIGINISSNSGEDETASTWLDVNGDGLPDKLYKNDTVALNLGYKFAPPELWNFSIIRMGESEDFGLGGGVNAGNMSFAAGVSYSKTENEATKSLQDVNDDGLLDLLLPGNPSQVRINSGNGFSPPVDWPNVSTLDRGSSTSSSVNAAFTYCSYVFPIFRICFNPQAFTTDGASKQTSQLGDIDGDGYTDLLFSDNDGHLNIRRSTIRRTNLLKKVERPFGAYFTLDYVPSTNTYEMPSSKWVLASVEFYDGFSGDGADWVKTTFEYEDGFFNRHEREFYGFNTVKTHQLDTENNDEIYRSTIAVYHNDSYYRKGLLVSETLQDGLGNVFSETFNTYELKDIFNGGTLPTAFANNDYAAAFPALTQTKKTYFEGQPGQGIQTTTSFEYDSLGNISNYTDIGDGTPNDLITAIITYHNNDVNYIKAIPASITVNTTATPQIRRRETTIDPAGNVLQIRQYLQDGSSANHNMEYDAYGNLRKITRPVNHRNERLHFEFEYDPIVHTYVTYIRDGYGYKSRSAYDLYFGKLRETVDMNGQKMVYTLDTKGRIATITGPYELAAGKPYTIAFEYYPDAATPYAKARHYDPEHDMDIETYTFMDGFMRPIQVKKTGSFFAGENIDDNVGMIVSGRITFDAFGRTISSRYPIVELQGAVDQYNTDIDTVPPAITTYDILDRQLSITLPDGATTTMTYDIGTDSQGFSHFRSTTVDALGNSKERYTDIKGRNRAMKDNGPIGEIWTDFHYNALSELIKVVDNDDNETTYTYDFLGRKLSMDHPDGGLTTFKYDLAGNMTEKVTANIREIIPNDGAVKYIYDKERLIEIDYPKNFQNKVQLHYGDSTATHNRVGRVWLQEDASGGQEFFYGPLGEVIKNIRTLLITEANVITFVSQSEYDTWNRIKRLFYPDGEIVTYTYNRAGKLRQMKGKKQTRDYTYVEQLGYDKFEQRTFLKYGNGTVTKYAYEPERRRLSALQVTNPAGRTFMDNTYVYDPVDNIVGMSNSGQAFHLQLGGPSKYSYIYDNLYRLSAANGEWEAVNRRDSFSLRLEYDNLHNITRKNQSHWRDTILQAETTYDNYYQYEGAKPHAPSKIGGRLYNYDANGNLSAWRGENFFSSRQIVWDEENRIMGISDNGYLSRYTYDANGERVIKSHGGVQGIFINAAPAGVVSHRDNYTAYVSTYFVAKEHRFTKHYYVEGQRIATKTGTGKFHNKFWHHGGITAGRRNYTHRIQLLQQSANAFYQAQGIAPGPPTLPGYYAQPEITGNPIPPFGLDSAYTIPPMGWPQPPQIPPPGSAPGAPTLPNNTTVTNDDVQAGYGFFGDGNFNHEGNQFFYHPDHLGSSSYITDINGQPRQHIEYLPFGETFVDEHTNSDVQPYLYNAKELDAETGLYYYGARYYDPKTSIWVSVDPMAEKYAGWSPYNYTLQNPVRFVDPDGKAAKSISLLTNMIESGTTMKIMQATADFSQSFADSYTGGLITKLNKYILNTGDVINKSAASRGGSIVGLGFSTALGAVLPSSKLVSLINKLEMGGLIADGAEIGYKFISGEAYEGIGQSSTLAAGILTELTLKDLNVDKTATKLVSGLTALGVQEFFDAFSTEKKGIRNFKPDKPVYKEDSNRIEIGNSGQRMSRQKSSKTGWDSEQ